MRGERRPARRRSHEGPLDTRLSRMRPDRSHCFGGPNDLHGLTPQRRRKPPGQTSGSTGRPGPGSSHRSVSSVRCQHIAGERLTPPVVKVDACPFDGRCHGRMYLIRLRPYPGRPRQSLTESFSKPARVLTISSTLTPSYSSSRNILTTCFRASDSRRSPSLGYGVRARTADGSFRG